MKRFFRGGSLTTLPKSKNPNLDSSWLCFCSLVDRSRSLSYFFLFHVYYVVFGRVFIVLFCWVRCLEEECQRDLVNRLNLMTFD